MQEVKVTVSGGIVSDEEKQSYIARGRSIRPHNELVAITVNLDGDYADIDYKYADRLMPQRFSIAGDMIIPDFVNLNKGKQAEYLDKVTNEIGDTSESSK